LPALGHRVVGVARTGTELVQQCRDTKPDLVITDIKMPDMDGIDAAAEVCRDRLVPVILVTAYQEPELLDRAGADHVVGYLVKPIKQADLAPAITLAVRRFDQIQSLCKETADLNKNWKLIDMARHVIRSDEVFHELDMC
jgi:response regulator NasT